MALLTGLTPEGVEVPVQVKPDGKLVAEGLTGPAGGVGPQGVAGPQGAVGPVGPKGEEKWEGTGNIYYVKGSVGIGTVTPVYQLDVRGAPGVGIQISENGTTQQGILRITQEDLGVTYDATYDTGSNKHRWLVGGSERMRLGIDGRLGIGTESPRSRLHASGVISANDGVDVQSPDGSWWNISVSDAGQVTATKAVVAS